MIIVLYSILTKYLGRDNIEEININAWNDIAITYTSGRTVKAKEHFYSPSHAVDIVKRLLHHSGMIIDNSTPMSQGHLPNNTRITALKEPIVDDDVGVSVSIRLLHPSRVNKKEIIQSGTKSAEDKFLDELFKKPQQVEKGYIENPSVAKTEKSRPSEHTSGVNDYRRHTRDENSSRPSVKKQIEELKEEKRKTSKSKKTMQKSKSKTKGAKTNDRTR